MNEAKPLPTTMVGGLHPFALHDDTLSNTKQYKSIVGALQYVTIISPKILFVVNKVNQYMHNPLDSHWKAVKWILWYFHGSPCHGLHLHKPSSLQLVGFSDAD